MAGNLSSHYRVCECGKKKTEPHKFTEFSSENGSQTVIKNVCPCGVAIIEYATPQTAIHAHAIEYAYDENNHWQICTDENCPNEYSTAPQAHSFTAVTDAEGRECNVCSVCNCYVGEGSAAVSGTVTSFGSKTDNIYLQLIAEGYSEANYEVVVKGNSATYSIEGVAAGTYTLRIIKSKHVTRDYTVTVGSTDVVKNAEIWQYGDVNLDGEVTVTDATALLRHVARIETITDAQALANAEVTNDDELTVTDATKILRYVARIINSLED
jgi:hypothetical protein